MIYVNVEAVKSEGRGMAGGNGWHDTDDPVKAVAAEMARHRSTWDALGHGAIVTYLITVAPEASPRRTIGDRKWPLPVSTQERDMGERHAIWFPEEAEQLANAKADLDAAVARAERAEALLERIEEKLTNFGLTDEQAVEAALAAVREHTENDRSS